MKTLTLVLLFATASFSQNVENILLSVYTGDGRLPETAFRPLIADKFSMSYTDITSVEKPDSVGLVLIQASYAAGSAPAIAADTTCIIIFRNPALNNRVQFSAFLARKKNGRALADAIAQKPNVNVDDIIAELRRIDRSKRLRRR